MRFELKAGLVLRHGQRTLELTRMLSTTEAQFEDTLTRRARVMKVAQVINQVHAGKLEVVNGGGALAATVKPNAAYERATEITDLSTLPETWRAQIETRLAYVKGLQAAHVTRGQRRRVAQLARTIAENLGQGKPPSSSTVMEWVRRYQTSDCNVLSLVDLKRLVPRARRLPQAVEDVIAAALRREYYTKSRHTLRHTLDCVRRELKRLESDGAIEPGATVSYATLVRRTKDVDAYHRISSREGDARARMVCRSSMTGTTATYPLQRVEVDHTMLNWVVVCERTGLPLGRPFLTVAIDAYSGYIVGMYLSFYGPGITSVTGVLLHSVEIKDHVAPAFGLKNPWLSHGLADEWVLDNGLEFHSKTFRAICWELRIDMTYCRVRTPWLKPHVERFFGELNCLTLARGRIHKPLANAIKIDPYKDAAITAHDLVKSLTMFAVDVHPFQINQRKLARPFDLFSEGLDRCPPAVHLGSKENLQLIAGLSERRTVSHDGVVLKNLPYGGEALRDLYNRVGRPFKTLCKWNPEDMSTLYVQDPAHATQWVTVPCRWADYARNLTWNQHRLIRAEARADLRRKGAEEALHDARMRLHDLFMDITRPRRKKESLLAARAAGITSARIYAGDDEPVLAPPNPDRIVVQQPLEQEEAGDFESFQME